jgi:L-lactate utilization protein LutB
LKKIVENLKKRGFDVEIFQTKDDARKKLIEEVGTGRKVGIGGSMTIKELDVYDKLKENGNDVLWHWRTEPQYVGGVLKEAMTADVYLTSSNALIENGTILNIDGNGNRVAAMFYGPKKVIMVCGKNKIASTYSEAMNRIKTVICPKNARRLNRNTPCAHTDKCNDCSSPDRMCMVTSLIEMKPPLMEYKIYLIEEEIGY